MRFKKYNSNLYQLMYSSYMKIIIMYINFQLKDKPEDAAIYAIELSNEELYGVIVT